MKRIKTAVIGGGHLGRIHAKLLLQNRAFDLVAICDPQPLTQQRLIQEFDLRVVSQYRKVLDDIDAAVIATPTTLHAEIALQCLERGLHVFIEKPLTPDAASARGIAQRANEVQRIVQVGHVERFNPSIAAAVATVGTPRFISATRASSYPFRSTDIGAIFDLMIHDIDLVAALFDSPIADVRAWGAPLMNRQAEFAVAHLTFANGGAAQLKASRCAPQSQRQWQVFGDRGYATVDLTRPVVEWVQFPEWLRGGAVDLLQLPICEQQLARDRFFELVLPLHEFEVAAVNAIAEEHRDWAEAIRGVAQPRVALRHAVQAVEIAELIELTIREQWTVEPPRINFGNLGATARSAHPEPAIPAEFLAALPARQAA